MVEYPDGVVPRSHAGREVQPHRIYMFPGDDRLPQEPLQTKRNNNHSAVCTITPCQQLTFIE